MPSMSTILPKHIYDRVAIEKEGYHSQISPVVTIFTISHFLFKNVKF